MPRLRSRVTGEMTSPIRWAIGGPAADGAGAPVPAPPPAAVPWRGRRPPPPPRRRPRQVARHRARPESRI
uniref:Uncharacterized protein n=1 Tax=Arundo donax TaxID=35708 RepID=A0A0A9GA25_ARUDO